MKLNTLSGKMPRRNLFVEIIAALLLLFFVHSVISNYIQLQSLKNLLAFYTRNTATVAWLMITAETMIALLLFLPKTRKLGFIAVLLAALFTGYLQLSKPYYPHDFGGIINYLAKNQQYGLYSLLILLSLTGLLFTVIRKKPKPELSTTDIVFT